MSITLKKQKKKSKKGLSMQWHYNAINLVHWDDPNELMNHLRLLDASHWADNNAYDYEILSIIEELREASLVTN